MSQMAQMLPNYPSTATSALIHLVPKPVIPLSALSGPYRKPILQTSSARFSGDAGVGESDDADRQRLQHGVVAFLWRPTADFATFPAPSVPITAQYETGCRSPCHAACPRTTAYRNRHAGPRRRSWRRKWTACSARPTPARFRGSRW